MASAEKYAAWIVANADKRGTPEFNTVAKAYQEAKARGVQPPKATPEANKRLQAITAEEKAARAKFEARQREVAEYEASTLGRILDVANTPFEFLGLADTDEELAARRQQKLDERLDLLRREREFIQRTGRAAPPPTVGQRVTGTLKSIPRGAIEGTFQGLGQMGILGEEGENVARSAEARGKKLAEDLGLGADEATQFDPLQQNLEAFGGGLGSIVPYLATEVAGRRAAPLIKAAPLVARGAQAVLGTGQGASQARQQMDEFEKETGQKLDPTTRQLVQAGGGVIGLSEVLPITRMLEALPAPAREAATSRISNILTSTGAGKLVPDAARTAIRETLQAVESRAVGRIATRGFAPEALQEGGAQLAQNVLERTVYNPNQAYFENVPQNALLGGLVGGTVRSGVEVTNALGGRAAANRQKAFEQNMGAVPPAEEFDINVGSPEDPTQLTRQRVQRLTDPDAEGNVFARRPDGTIFQTAMTELYRMRVPTEGIRAIPIPETLSAPAVTERLTASLGETTVDPDIQSYIKSVTTTLNNNMALGTPENTETYLQKQQNSLRRSRLPEEVRIARMLVLDEAAKLNNEYLGLVTAPPAAPDTAPDTAPEVTEQPAVVSDEQIQSQVDAMREMSARRTAALESIAGDPEVVDKVSAFEDLMAQDGFGAPTPVETTYLLDVMRAESEAETVAGQQKDMTDRQRIVDRANIIEGVLYDDRVAPEKKAERIGIKLRNKGYKPLNRYEVERLAGFEAVNAVFGPEGEYTQRRQELMDQVLADSTITDKYRGFSEALDQFPELGDPTVEEIRMLRGDAAPIEAEIAPGGEPTPLTMQVPARPGGLPAEIIDRGVVGEPEMAAPEMVEEPTPEPEPAPTDTFRTDLADYGSLVGRGDPVPEELTDSIADKVIDLVENNDTATLAELSADPELGPVIEQFFTNETAAINKRGVERAKATAAPQAAPEQPAPTAATQAINNPEEDILPVEERLEADPDTIEGAFPAALNRPRAEAIGFAADLEQRVKRMSSRFTRALNYKYQNAADYSQALAASYGLTRLPDNLNVARKFEMLESRKVGGQMRLNRWYLQPIEDKIKELGLDPKDVGMYLWARSAPARNALVLQRNGEQNGSGMSDAQAQAQLDKLELEGLGPKLREVAKLHDALVDYIGNQRVKAGLISRADWKAMRKAQPFYTPLKGYASAGDMQVDGDPDPHSDEERGIAARNGTRVREVLTARGRESMPFNPLFNLMSDAQFAVARIEQNKVKETFLNNVLSDPKSHEGLVKVYTPKKEKHASGLVTMPKIGPNGPVNMNQIAAQKNPELMIVKKDGKPYYIEFARTSAGNALYRAFANMTPPELGKFMRGAQEVSNTIKSFKTRYNPVYIGSTAWARDFNEAILTAYAAQGIKGGPAAGTKLARRTARYIASLDGASAISGYLNGRDPTTAEGEVMTLLFDQFLEDGGAVGHAQIMDAESYAQDTAKTIERYAATKRGNPVAAALMAKDMTAKALDNASQLIDLQARFATYRAAIEEGISREDAAALALDSSLNLTRRGELSPWLDTFSFFFSPTVEGTRKLVSQGRYSTIARKLFGTTMMAGALLYLFNRFGPGEGDDDEDGRPNILDVNNATAQTRLVVRYGSGVNDYVAVPVAFGMGFFAYTGGQIMAAVLGDVSPEEAGFNIVGGFMNMASPIKTEGAEGLTGIVNFVIPDPVQPVWDLVVNRNAFGSRIYTPQEYRTEPKSELGREETGEGWKFIAQGINSLFGGNATVESWASMQPEQYRYAVQQLLGGAYGVGRDTVDLFTGEAKPDQILAQRIPIIKSFFGKGGEYVPMNKFYEDYDDLNALYTVYNAEEPDYEAQAENKEKFPVETDPTVMDAFGEAKSALRKISSDYKDGTYASKEDMLAARNEVYKEFNRIYADAKREGKE